MRQGFSQFSIPYMNELTANQFNASSVFNGNMPLGFVNYSMDVISNFFQNPDAPQVDPKTGMPNRPQDFETVIINGRKVLRRKISEIDTILGLPGTGTQPTTPPIAGGTNPANQCPPGEVPYTDILGFKRCGKRMQSDPTPEEKEKAGISSNVFGSFELLNTKVVVILIGLVLLVAAIVSLR